MTAERTNEALTRSVRARHVSLALGATVVALATLAAGAAAACSGKASTSSTQAAWEQPGPAPMCHLDQAALLPASTRAAVELTAASSAVSLTSVLPDCSGAARQECSLLDLLSQPPACLAEARAVALRPAGAQVLVSTGR